MLYDIIQSAAVSRGSRLSAGRLIYRDRLPHRRRNYNLTGSLNISYTRAGRERTDGRTDVTMLHRKSASGRLTITAEPVFLRFRAASLRI